MISDYKYVITAVIGMFISGIIAFNVLWDGADETGVVCEALDEHIEIIQEEIQTIEKAPIVQEVEQFTDTFSIHAVNNRTIIKLIFRGKLYYSPDTLGMEWYNASGYRVTYGDDLTRRFDELERVIEHNDILEVIGE